MSHMSMLVAVVAACSFCNCMMGGFFSDPCLHMLGLQLADFGLSRLLDPTMTHVSTKSYGTISYMPAEVLKEGRLTTAADVYSFAMMMWEMYHSQALFEGQTMAQARIPAHEKACTCLL